MAPSLRVWDVALNKAADLAAKIRSILALQNMLSLPVSGVFGQLAERRRITV